MVNAIHQNLGTKEENKELFWEKHVKEQKSFA